MLAKLLLTLFALMFWVVIAGAADSPPKAFPFAYTQEDLPNGLRLIAISTDSKNLVSLFIVVQAGLQRGRAGQDWIRPSFRAPDVSGHSQLSAVETR